MPNTLNDQHRLLKRWLKEHPIRSFNNKTFQCDECKGVYYGDVTKPSHYFTQKQYPVTLYPEKEGGFTVKVEGLQGCLTQAEDSREALQMADDAKTLWIQEAIKHEEPFPAPPDEWEHFVCPACYSQLY